MITKTFKELQELDQIVGGMYRVDPLLKDTKFGYAYKRLCDKYYIPAIKDYNEAINDARIDHALEDPVTKEILRDSKSPRGYKYSKEEEKKIAHEERKITDAWNLKEIQVEPFISAHIPPELTEEQTAALTGILI